MHGHCHEVLSSDIVGHAWYQIDQHEQHNIDKVSDMIKFLNFKKLTLVSTDIAMRSKVVMKYLGHVGYQIDQYEKHNYSMKGLNIFNREKRF